MQNLGLNALAPLLAGFLRERSPLPALRVLHARLGSIFQVPLPGFRAYFTAGAEANRQVLVSGRESLRWRSPGDPVTDLLRRGVLVVDGEEHDRYRGLMEPLLAPGHLPIYVDRILYHVERVSSTWKSDQRVDMLVESRRMALLIVMDTLFSVDIWEDLPRLWTPILKAIAYISPGAWMLFPRLPRPGYRHALATLDEALYAIIRKRRNSPPQPDLLGHLLAGGLDDERIRDQMLTMLIAGHDTSTALLAWTFLLLGQHSDVYAQLTGELDQALHGQPPSAPSGWQPPLLDQVIKEALRLYPPIHVGSRRAAEDIEVAGCPVHAGERLMVSIYLTQRDPAVWAQPEKFDPQRFARGHNHPPFSYVPFGGGPRGCIGAAFGMVEARLVLARLLQTHHFELLNPRVRAHMGATLEPRPGVFMRVYPREAEVSG